MSGGNRTPETALSYRPADCSVPVLERSIGDALRAAAARHGNRTALVEGVEGPRRRWTYSQLLADAEQVARALLGRFQPGEHVAVFAANSPEWVLLEMGAALAGLTLVTVNPAFLAQEVAYVLGQSRASGVVVQPEYRGRDLLAVVAEARSGLPHLREVIALDGWSAFLASGVRDTVLPDVAPLDIAQIQYTSGTTGFPKGACLTHRGLANNGRLFARAIGAGPEDVWVNPMPMFHTAGCGLVTLGALQTGGVHVLPPAFDPALLLALFEAERGTVMLSVPTMLIRLLDHPDARTRDLTSWRLSALGGAPVPPELARRAAEEVGLKVTIGFGQTEASPYITHTVPDDPNPDWIETVGRPLPQTELKVIDPLSGETVPLGVVGEICARGCGVMAGYFDNPGATAHALDAEGWLHTGDLGSLDAQGYCRIQGRLKDMIIRGGENIYPREIEDVLFTHPGIANVSVVGVPDAEWGEQVAAFIQPRAGVPVGTDELATFCRAHLAPFKVPRIWRVVTAFPQTASGKIQKFALREQVLREKETVQ
ncbi:AMP-binding protein [Aquabacter sp. P-9]|uniref:AMP-binding protein n=1 Tax=Aquabacter sediminis TaxID=3029197 RepID=UPI00237E6AA3|nr:AMP-binding protein [Aquabacter sp. P-9]MDE1566580.1 AMP-binding protein [Aquabacter sp. P-9]